MHWGLVLVCVAACSAPSRAPSEPTPPPEPDPRVAEPTEGEEPEAPPAPTIKVETLRDKASIGELTGRDSEPLRDLSRAALSTGQQKADRLPLEFLCVLLPILPLRHPGFPSEDSLEAVQESGARLAVRRWLG
jgi:hypothetical protein